MQERGQQIRHRFHRLRRRRPEPRRDLLLDPLGLLGHLLVRLQVRHRVRHRLEALVLVLVLVLALLWAPWEAWVAWGALEPAQVAWRPYPKRKPS